MNRLTTISFVAVIALAAILLTSSMAHVSPVVAKKSSTGKSGSSGSSGGSSGSSGGSSGSSGGSSGSGA